MKNKIKPKDVSLPLSDKFWGMSKRNERKIASHICRLAQQGNEWKPFSFCDYIYSLSYNPSNDEKLLLDYLVGDGYLEKCKGNIYKFTQKMIDAYTQYLDGEIVAYDSLPRRILISLSAIKLIK